MKKLLLIVNPRAGKTKSREPLFDAVSVFSDAGYLVKVRTTKAKGDAARIAAEESGGYDAVVCSGGDGTLNETLNGLMQLEKRPPLGYLPGGSTNDFAATLKIADNLPAAALDITASGGKLLDIGRFRDRYFVYVASFGAFTKSSYTAPQTVKNTVGHFAYIMEGVKDLNTLRPYQARVTADGEIFQGQWLFGAVCNSTSLGGLMKLNPEEVKLDDGKFELLLIPMPKSPSDLQNLLMALLSQRYNEGGLIFRHVSDVQVESEEELPWSLDGEYANGGRKAEMKNLCKEIRFLL